MKLARESNDRPVAAADAAATVAGDTAAAAKVASEEATKREEAL